eukprot:GILK01015501.1.p1 GENE.GILK01015501.1~~GILK01015501.1.p1  ORF type:complete len:122 (+),score=27.74 GILK01015501.1:31-366(+)
MADTADVVVSSSLSTLSLAEDGHPALSKTFTAEEVAAHKKSTDCWIIIDGVVYNVTSFLASHPGGKRTILDMAGKDATTKFRALHNPEETLRKYGQDLIVGRLDVSAVPKE